MSNLRIATASLVFFAMAGTAGAAFAAPAFSIAAPGSGMPMNQFESQLSIYNAAEVTDLVAAKTVSVVKYDSAWNNGKDMGKAVDLLTEDSQSINLLREGIKANPAASKLLADNKIVINDVVDITSDGVGNVTIYVS